MSLQRRLVEHILAAVMPAITITAQQQRSSLRMCLQPPMWPAK
jgi:hypothetical protein